jgi:hypothetical protein
LFPCTHPPLAKYLGVRAQLKAGAPYVHDEHSFRVVSILTAKAVKQQAVLEVCHA